jgi:purine-binding chemotaxis protein CheW
MITPSIDKRMQVLYFKADDLHVCIELCHVEKIVSLAAIDPLPQCAAYVAGLLNIAGHNIMIIDLARYLGKERHQYYSLDTPILILKHQEIRLGMIIDKIIKISNEAHDSIQPLHPIEHGELFKGVLPIDNQLTLLLNTNLITGEEKSLCQKK